MAEVKIPDELKADLPPTRWGKILTATPIIMTVVATALAGLSSSEMTRAQYSRSLAAQQQSKAGDQWAFFQAKRLRGAMQRSTLDLLRTATDVPALDAATLAGLGLSPEIARALLEARMPDSGPAPVLAPELADALRAIETGTDLPPEFHRLADAPVIAALRAAQDRAQAFDAATRPVIQVLDHLDERLAQSTTELAVRRSVTATRLAYNARRYDAEAALNRAVATLYEVQVRQSNLSAERHHRRSQRFFYGMLGAQAAVIISTFSLAARQRSLLWALAATAGSAAIGFAAYVYLFS